MSTEEDERNAEYTLQRRLGIASDQARVSCMREGITDPEIIQQRVEAAWLAVLNNTGEG